MPAQPRTTARTKPIFGDLIKAFRLGFRKAPFGTNVYMWIGAMDPSDQVIWIKTCPLHRISEVAPRASRGKSPELPRHTVWWEDDSGLIASTVLRYIQQTPQLASYRQQAHTFSIPVDYVVEEPAPSSVTGQ